jgi:hypothetical protein
MGAIQYWEAEAAYQRQSPDPYRIADQAVRFVEFRATVPANAILGYLADVPAEDILATSMLLTSSTAVKRSKDVATRRPRECEAV